MNVLLSVSAIAAACPELSKSECEALRDHIYDTSSGDVGEYAIQAAARSLFPYSAKPLSNVVPFDSRHYIRTAIQKLQEADFDLGRMKPKNDNLAQIQLDVQCCIHYLNEELGEHHV